MKKILFLAVAVMLFWSAPLSASEQAPNTSGDETQGSVKDGSGSRVRTKIGLGGGYPELIALSFAVGVPNVLEGELSVGSFIGRITGALRVGYPWTIIGKTSPGWWVSVVPKIGFRAMWQEVLDFGSGNYGAGGSRSIKGNEVGAIGLNGVASIEIGYIIGERFGLLLQLTAGATWLFAGQNEHVQYLISEDLEKTRTAEDNSPWSPDLRATLVFTF